MSSSITRFKTERLSVFNPSSNMNTLKVITHTTGMLLKRGEKKNWFSYVGPTSSMSRIVSSSYSSHNDDDEQ